MTDIIGTEHPLTYRSEATIIGAGVIAECLYLIKRGEIAFRWFEGEPEPPASQVPSGREGEDVIVGARSFFGQVPMPWQVVSISETSLCYVERVSLESACQFGKALPIVRALVAASDMSDGLCQLLIAHARNRGIIFGAGHSPHEIDGFFAEMNEHQAPGIYSDFAHEIWPKLLDSRIRKIENAA